MTNFDLEERTFQFGKACGLLVKQLSKDILSIEFGKQLLRASSSVGANYIEANESHGVKDFQMHLKICRKEAKESGYWLRMLKETSVIKDIIGVDILIVESVELRNIFSSIINKLK